MASMTTITDDQARAEITDVRPAATRRVSADLKIGLAVLGVVVGGRLLWALSDGSLVAAITAR
jgi:hypothetical protein